jgi:methylenetetrahydrofolate--tRNA-(uracil-5-)-methyltransferase
MSERVTVIGGGLAGAEAALQLAARGISVDLHEMRPAVPTPAHRTERLAEIVCSNSFKSTSTANASGLLKQEMKRLGCILIPIAEECRVEAGSALAVDREEFSARVTARVQSEDRITLHRAEVRALPEEGPVIAATGPLTSEAFAACLVERLGAGHLWFHDATAPIVAADSVDRTVAFRANRRETGEGEYLNCPLDEAQYDAFVAAVLAAERYPLHDFERGRFFEACMPIDELVRRGRLTLAFGPMRPVGLIDPRTGRRPFAVVQLRPENRQATAYNLVGFQNRMRHGDQRRVLRLIPGLENAEFHRLGRVHRNTYLDAPRVLTRFLEARTDARIRIAGQLTGLEGYVECVATGMLSAAFVAASLRGLTLAPLPRQTMLGALLEFCSAYEGAEYRPTNANFGLLPALDGSRAKSRERNALLAARASTALEAWMDDPAVAAAFPTSRMVLAAGGTA